GRHVAYDRSRRRLLGPLPASDDDVMAKLDHATVPAFLPRPDNSLSPPVGATSLIDLGMDGTGERPGALDGPGVGDRLLTDDLGALKHCVPQGLAADLLRHELQPTADVLGARAPESHRYPHAGLSSWQSNWSSS